MASTETFNQGNTTRSTRSARQIVLSVIFLLPALFLCLTDLFIPTIRTFWLSLQSADFFGGGGEFVGVENYAFLIGDPNFRQSLSFTISSLIVRLLVVAVVPPLLAWAVAQFGRRVRFGLRALLTVPLVLFMPVAIAIAWLILLDPVDGLFPSSLLASPNSSRAILLLIDALYTFGAACGLGLIFYLPVWRHSSDASSSSVRETLKPFLAIWGGSILAVIVLSLSAFTLSFVMTGGGPGNSTSPLGLWMYQSGFVFFRFGPAASIASILLLVTLASGVVAGLLIILTRLRLTTVDTLSVSEPTDKPAVSSQSKALPAVALVLTLLLALGACSLSVLPFGWAAIQSFGESNFASVWEEISVARVLGNTFVPPLLAAVVQLLTAYLAALGIGALQPLGRHSTWILLLFSPWLFITDLPLSLVNILSAQENGTLSTFTGLIFPILFSVPAFFIFTIFFMGRTPHWQKTSTSEASSSGAFLKHLILPSLPLVGVLFLFLLFIGSYDFFWPLVANSQPEYYSLSVTLAQLLQSFSLSRGGLAFVITSLMVPIVFFYFIALVLVQILYLDRLVLYSENSFPE